MHDNQNQFELKTFITNNLLILNEIIAIKLINQ